MSRPLLVLATAMLASAALAFSPSVSAKDDAAKLKEKREALRTHLKEKKEGMPFYDLFFYVDAKKLEDSRWSMLPIEGGEWRRGMQLRAKWEMVSPTGDPKTITVIVFKAQHVHNNSKSVREFKHWGKTVEWKDMNGLIEGFFEDYKRSAKDVIEDLLVAPKKAKSAGPAKHYASVTATDPNSNARERHDWYLWAHGKYGATYKAEIAFSSGTLKSEGLLDKGQKFMKLIKEVKDKRNKWQ